MKFFRDPLFHFLVIGTALFALFSFTGENGESAEDPDVFVSSGRIEQLEKIFFKTWQRPPTQLELKSIIDDFVLEEIYYREAKKMGLDQDDTMIRRRLRQKLEFLSDDTADLASPTDQDLQAYLTSHPDKFALAPTFTFRQLYFNPDNHGDSPEKTISAFAESLNAGGQIESDRTLLPETLNDARSSSVDSTFGTGFAESLTALPSGTWAGPVQSGLGYHLVKIHSVTPGRLPSLEEARPVVVREWQHDRRTQAREAYNSALLERYDVVIEQPVPAPPAAPEQ